MTTTLFTAPAFAQDCPVKVGVLHSLSGSMAISETTLKDVMLMLVDGQNAKGGVLGCEIETVVVDPASDWPLFAEKARELLTVNEVDVIFGSWTSVSRKSALPVLEELNGLMFYPVQYEGENRRATSLYRRRTQPAGDPGGGLLPRGTGRRKLCTSGNRLCLSPHHKQHPGFLPEIQGHRRRGHLRQLHPFGHSDWATIVSDVVALGASGKQVGVISTINGDANVGFYKELAAQGVDAADIPVVAFSVGEEELSGLDTAPLVGHLAAWNYFQSADTPENEAFIAAWHDFIGDTNRVTNDPMEAHYIGFNMWVNAVEAAGTTDVDAVRTAMWGQEFPNLTGGMAVMNANHHLSKPVLIGEIRDDGQFDIISQTTEVSGDAWTDHLPESAPLKSDWKDLGCGMFNTETNSCVQMTSNY